MTNPSPTIAPLEPIEGKALYSTEDHFYLAATIWAEARGEGPEGMRQVAHVIKNRVDQGVKRFGFGYRGVVQRDWQFSCWNPNDPNRKLLTQENLDRKLSGKDAVRWKEAQKIAEAVLLGADPDPTKGADHYHTTRVSPPWTRTVDKQGRTLLVKVAQVGSHVFYKPR